MSRAVVRQQIADFLSPPVVPGVVDLLAECFPHPPKVTLESKFDLAAGGGSGAVVYVHLVRQRERRIALGGEHNGRKWREYDVTLICALRSAKGKAEDADADNDRFLDSLAARIQSDRNFGTGPVQVGDEVVPGMIFQAGEGSEDGGDDVEMDVGLPSTIKGQLTQIITMVRLTVCEVLDT